MNKTFSSWLRHTAAIAGLALAGTGMAQAATQTISFGVPPWPGVTVKTEITEQLLEALGYDTDTQNVGVPFIYRGLERGSTTVFMGAWMPAQTNMLKPMADKGKIDSLGSNLSSAVQGLAVPGYVWNQGIHSIKDLAAHPDMFRGQIHGIEAGSAMDQAIGKAVDDNYEGLGKFRLVPSSTAAMLAEVQHATPKKQPVVFLAWRPHWMNIKFDIHYLNDKPDSPIAGIKSDVLTLVSGKFGDENVKTFLHQIHIDAKTQSEWIYSYSYDKKDLDDVAKNWLASHPKMVGEWLKGVKTRDGKPGFAAYQQAFGS